MCAQAPAGESVSTNSRELKEMALKVERETSSSIRAQVVSELALRARQVKDPQEIDDDTINAISRLLGDREDAVRSWAAVTLGNLGPRAQSAVPALMTALRGKECVGYPSQPYIAHSLTSADGIRMALEKIGAKAPNSVCEP